MESAVVGGVGMSFFVAGTACGESLGDSQTAKCCIFHTKCASKIGQVRSPKRRVRDDDFMLGVSSDCPWMVLESSSYWRKQFKDFR